MYQALYRKYRPNLLSDVVGQKIIISTLKNAIKNNKISHAYLFTGPRGTGKTTIAKAFAKIVNCENPNEITPCDKCVSCTQTNLKQNTDIIEIDAASNNGVDEIREIRNKVMLAPTYGKYKIYIIDEVHMLTIGAFNALLKTLEEPPSHVIFILATTEPHKIPITILSRCQRFDIKRISKNDIFLRLKYICDSEKINIEDDALYEIADLSDGGMRDAISLLDQVSSYVDSENTIRVKEVNEVSGTLDTSNMKEFMVNLLNLDIQNVLFLLKKYDEDGINIKKLTERIMEYLEKIIIFKETPKYLETIVNDVSIYKELPNVSNDMILNCINELNFMLPNISSSTNPKLLLEISLIKLINLMSTNKKDLNDAKIKNEDIKTYASNVHKTESAIEKQRKNKVLIENNDIEKYTIKDKKIYEKFKNQRINNTLSRLDKKKISEVTNFIETIKLHVFDSEYKNYVSMFMDIKVKATSQDLVIFVFDEQSVSDSFNEQIPILQKVFFKITSVEKNFISVSSTEWDVIKKEFNSKQKQYLYDSDIIGEDKVYEKKVLNNNEIENMFDECIEYA